LIGVGHDIGAVSGRGPDPPSLIPGTDP